MRLHKLLFVFVFFYSCQTSKTGDTVDITLLQLNDVYEISPVSGGQLGGFARVQTLLNDLKAENPNTYSFLSGDMLSPSAIGVAKYNDSRIAGEQMVDVLNAMNWDYFTFGNHEFDLKEPDLLKRLNEMKFKLITDNVLNSEDQMFPNTRNYEIITVGGIQVGIMGVMYNTFNPKYANISDPIAKAKEVVAEMKTKNVDIIIAMTHQSLSADEELASTVPEIDLIMGGHEHENINILRGDNYTPITKADANAKSAFVHSLKYNKSTKQLKINSELVFINDQLKKDPSIDSLVNKWTNRAYKAFEEKGFKPEQEICTINEVLDGSESAVRNRSTKLTKLITQSFLTAYPEADISILNGGTVRLDDKFQPGPITQYDIIRISPFLGEISLVEMQGKTILQTIDVGNRNAGSGGFLHFGNINRENNTYYIDGEEIKARKWYKVAITSYMVERGDRNLGFLTFDKGQVKKTDDANQKFYDVVANQFVLNYTK
ncbi:MAG: bifunctional metallophosphatase/5'-nucleotidase [bacterium]|nr:bifunctional metallophosphatase/5'-nucleotidase [bacterium]